ncbi:hypothetical protein B0H14DRAFT_2584785 [Mycena olivaceomarginata]|nr:hypothetical protein B0H14DRAFT_2584785 [Mycena olivaceomarginata]
MVRTPYCYVSVLMLGAPSIFNWNVGCSRPKIRGRSQVFDLSSGAPIAPTEGSWEHPASLTGSIQGTTEKLLGASRYITWAVPSPLENMIGGSQDYYKGAPTTVRREFPCSLGNPECRSVVNPAEVGNAFHATVEAGIGVQGGEVKSAHRGQAQGWGKGKMHSAVQRAGQAYTGQVWKGETQSMAQGGYP